MSKSAIVVVLTAVGISVGREPSNGKMFNDDIVKNHQIEPMSLGYTAYLPINQNNFKSAEQQKPIKLWPQEQASKSHRFKRAKIKKLRNISNKGKQKHKPVQNKPKVEKVQHQISEISTINPNHIIKTT